MPSHLLSTVRQQLMRIAFLGALAPWTHVLATAQDFDGIASAEEKAISVVGIDAILSETDVEIIQNLIREDRYDEAEAIVEGRLQTHPDDGRALANRSRILTYRAEQFRDNSRINEALEIAERSIQLLPNDPLPYIARANAHRIAQRYEKAFADATTAVQCDPNFPMAHVIRGFACHHLHDLEGMGREAKIGLEIDPRHPESRAMLAAYLFAKGKLDEGISQLDRAIATTPKMAALYFLKGYALEKKGLHREAVDYFTKAIEINDQIPGYFCRRAISLGNAGDFRAALRDVDAAESIMPTYFDVASARAMITQKQKGYGHSGQTIAVGLQSNPQSADLWQGKGFNHYSNRQYSQAIDAFQKALEINPGYGEAHMGIGMVCIQQGKLDEALIHLNRATRHKEHLGRAYFEKSLVYIAKKDYESAKMELDNAIKYEPGNATYQQQLKNIQRFVK
ncbi:tetratricopeptide repeat protein [Pirellulaceae bacterium SH449]